jgi:hypothetical protein
VEEEEDAQAEAEEAKDEVSGQLVLTEQEQDPRIHCCGPGYLSRILIFVHPGSKNNNKREG